MSTLVGALLAVALLCGCGATPVPTSGADGVGGPGWKMRHQIVFGSGDEAHVFEGYMILSGDGFVVQAFAGPGVDLFTVRRDGAAHSEELHIDELADRIDMAAVGADIARVYLGGCPGEAAVRSCEILGEPVEETRDETGKLVLRRFPEAHGTGLEVEYAELTPYPQAGTEQPRRITLRWGTGEVSMRIILLEISALERVDRSLFATP